ncbi:MULTISPECIES: hypothetical protein [unclassified Actinomyces]|uniref:hypothetical protein n=1 Tax=unclassified Actinomyces TaxID=2609248 RepID=UPI000D5958EA|nr:MULTISPECIES: hypothetical protein [unclassified Actinomyces]RAX20259.1 hypothetical protein DRB07_14370 [Actinomyces sp. Z3]
MVRWTRHPTLREAGEPAGKMVWHHVLDAPIANDTANPPRLTTAEGHYPAVFPDTLRASTPARRRPRLAPGTTDLGT